MPPTPYLAGNNDPCPACELRREFLDTSGFDREEVPCNVCHGKGYLPLEAAEFVRRTVEEAKRWYWPEWDRRNGTG